MINIDAEKYHKILSSGSLEDLTSEEQESLRRVLTSGVFIKAIKHVMYGKQEQMLAIVAQTFSQHEAPFIATSRQGMIQGLQMAVDILLECSSTDGNEGEDDG